MQKLSYVILLSALAFSACNNDGGAFKKGQKGLEYKIISSGGNKVKYGEYLQIHVGEYYDTGKSDSLLSDSRNASDDPRNPSGPRIQKVDTGFNALPEAYYEILSQLKNHDSLILRLSTDSAFKNMKQGMPAGFKKGHYIYTRVKVLNIFATKESADSADMVERKISNGRDSIALNLQYKKDSIKLQESVVKDQKVLEDYFAKNNIKAVKAPKGTYVEIIKPGTGNNIDTSVLVSTNYTGKTMDGQMFDSNTDPSKGHVEPLYVNMTNDRTLGGGVIKGWTDGLTLLNKGAKAKFYVPAALAYGPMDRPGIPANSILVFDIEVVDVYNHEQARGIAKQQMEKYRAKQKKYMDSLQQASKLKADTGIKK